MIFYGKDTADGILQQVKTAVTHLKQHSGKIPVLKVILVGDNPASVSYISRKVKFSQECGIDASVMRFSPDISAHELKSAILQLNADERINGILCQLPLPGSLNLFRAAEIIDPFKDVDCFHPLNLGKIITGNELFYPCTPAGIILLLDSMGIELKGKSVTVVGRSNIVGTPLSLMLSRKGCDATVTLCHSGTPDLKARCASADILICAVGKAGFFTQEYIKSGAVVIDVGTNPSPPDALSKKPVGDVLTEEAAQKCSRITPVPGGVGPMTVAMLMFNTVNAALYKHKLPVLTYRRNN